MVNKTSKRKKTKVIKSLLLRALKKYWILTCCPLSPLLDLLDSGAVKDGIYIFEGDEQRNSNE